MTVWNPSCTKEVTDKLLVVEENKRKCVFQNPDGHLLTKVQVDGCQITQGVRCDYLIIDHCRNEYFVELKGKDFPHAIEQLEATIKQLASMDIQIKRLAIIVSSRFPSNDTTLQRAKVLFKKKYRAELQAKNIVMEIRIR